MPSLDDASRKEQQAGVYKLRSQLLDVKAKLKQSEERNQKLQDIINFQSERLDSKYGKFALSPSRKASGGFFYRVLIPDTHGSHIDKLAATAFLGDLERLQPREIICLGDHLDCGGFLAQHHTIGFVAEMGYSYADDIDEANKFFDAVQERAPNADKHMVTGNHEHRVQRWCIQQSIGNPRDADMHLRHYSVEHVLHLAKRGIKYYPRDYLAKGSRAQGSFRLGSCSFVHDVSISRNPARDAINRWASNVFFGDTHRLDLAFSHKAGRNIVAGTCGHLSSNRRYWNETNLTDWMHGYGLQIVSGDGEYFQPILVPIDRGKSMLCHLIDRVK